ncbi:MAG: TolC family protein, partial [Prevotella sp.]|nr:TolC family protein [Prevotella sp.]
MKTKVMARAMLLGLLVLLPLSGECQRVLTLDSCRAMALRNNKQMGVAKMKQEVSANLRKSARTKYLPHVSALGGYVWMSREISLLDNDKKDALNNLGTNAAASLSSSISSIASQLPAATQAKIAQDMAQFTGALNQTGQGLVNALRTDTKNMFAGAIMVTQPVFMGGAITAVNKIADINEEMAANSLEMKRQGTLYNIEQAYWQVVSLRHKQKLAE